MTDPPEAVARVVLVVLAFAALPLLVGHVEHKLVARVQGRLGPMYAGGFHGWAQLLADGVKFAQKEDVLPARADRAGYRLAVGAALVPYLAALAFLPLAPGWVGADVDAGLLVVLALLSVTVIAPMVAGWATGSARWLSSALSHVGQVLGYTLPFLLAAVSVALAAGTVSLTGIVEQWEPWWMLWQAIGLAVFLTAGLAMLSRSPFGAPSPGTWNAGGGWAAGYAGLRYAVFVFAQYAGLLLLCALTTVVYLGAWVGPGPDGLGPVWTLAKAFLLVGAVVWVGATLPQLRPDQVRRLPWRGLLPLAAVQLVVTTAVVM